MLMTIADYEKIKGVTLATEEVVKVETLIEVAIGQIEEKLGYSLEEKEITERYIYNKVIYLNCRPVQEVISITHWEGFFSEKNYIEFPNFRDCACKEQEYIGVTYVYGFKELPLWIKYEIVGLIDSFINEMSEEAKLTSYKIDDISYSFRDFSYNKIEKINKIVGKIYG